MLVVLAASWLRLSYEEGSSPLILLGNKFEILAKSSDSSLNLIEGLERR